MRNRKRNLTVTSLDSLSLEEADAYMEAANDDEIDAAFALAADRNRLDDSTKVPDEAEIHHALYLLRRAQGKDPPSFDGMRVEIRRRVAA